MEKQLKPYDVPVNSLGFCVDRLLYALIRRRNQDLREMDSDIMHSEFVVLKVLSILKGATQTQLAQVMAKERSGVGRLVASLQKKGYVEIKPKNGSTNFVTLTEKGEQMKDEIVRISDMLTEQAFKGFSEKKRASILNSLHKIYENLTGDEK